MVAEIVATGTTPAGTAWTRYRETLAVDTVYWAVGNAAAGDPVRGVLYCHGAGGEADQFLRTHATAWTPTFLTIIDNGGVIVECYGNGSQSVYNGRFGWGRPFARPAYLAAALHVASILTVPSWVVVGRSMGGLVGKQIAVAPGALTVTGYVDVSGIYDMLAEYDSSPPPGHFDLPGWWGTPDTDRAALATATTGYDPARFAPSVWAGIDVLVVYGTADTTAVPAIAGGAFWSSLSGVALGPRSKVVPVAGATHATAGGTYGHVSIGRFILECWGIVPVLPEPGDILRILSIDVVGDDGYLRPVTLTTA